MSCSKPLPPFVCDSLYYLNRDQLERFLIICRPLKNFIERYFHSKPYRIFDGLEINGGLYVLYHNRVEYFSFAEMRPYLSSTVRIKDTTILVDASSFIYSPEHIKEMESLAHLWSNHKISILNDSRGTYSRIVAKDFQPILNSPIILQCRELRMTNPDFSLKDYKVLYTVKVFEICYNDHLDFGESKYLAEFLEQPRLKPIVDLHISGNTIIANLLDRLSKDFSSAKSPNSFKIAIYFSPYAEFEPLIEFRKTNITSSEKLELKKGLPTGYQTENWEEDVYTLERSMI
ncbi:hypothetical protein Ddc_22766 [Ditylenchus destructor]|nr:hypothetical protein Ddc_22766 [Ditylenchus destructor]